MTGDSDSRALFTPGASFDAAPAGDAERQAIDSLGGYTYQVGATALAWLDLPEGSRIYLEVAEDYTTVASQALTAVQVKDTAGSGSVTLNTDSVRDAVDAFVSLVKRNPGRAVELRYFTTSPLGTERKIADRPAGQSGLAYWRKAAAGADVEPLRRILKSDDFSDAVRAFVNARDNDALRHELLQRIHWECGKPDLFAVRRELEERLVVLGRDRFQLPAAESKRLADVLMHYVLTKSILKNADDRVLSRADLYAAIDAATRMSMPRASVDTMAQLASALSGALVGRGAQSAEFAPDEVGWLVIGTDLPDPRLIIARPPLETTVSEALSNHGITVLVGGSGLGKSIVARAVARRRAASFLIVDLRDLDAGETRRRLDFIFARMGTLDASVMILEDFNHFEDSSVTLSLARVMSALRRRDRVALVTSYRKPSTRSLVEAGLDPGAVVDVPYFSEAEAGEVVRASGGAPETWGPIAYVVGGQGHPQLVHAFTMGMAARGWPVSELRKVVVRGLSSDETDAARDEARRSLAAALPEEARTLLYRLSLVIGRFDRSLALAIGALSPAVARAGESMDVLVGPWIERVDKHYYRVSPLAGQSGLGSLTTDEQRAIHALIATQMLSRRKIDASDANMVLGHALAGKSEQSLVTIAHNVLTSKQEALALLSDHFFLLRMLRTDRPIYADNRTVSGMLRLAQFRLVAAGGQGKDVSECVAALLRETSEASDAEFSKEFETLALSSILITIGIGDDVADWVALLRRFRRLVEGDSDLRGFKDNVERAPGSEGISFYGAMFAIGAIGISSVARLEQVINDLDKLDADERAMWLEGYQGRLNDFGIFVSGPWSEEHKRGAVNGVDAAERYKRMAAKAAAWGIRPLSLQLHIARAVMLDEYTDDRDAALRALDEGAAELGNDIVLERAYAKILSHSDDHVAAMQILRRIADQVGRTSPVERAFSMREAAISAAKTGDWRQAEQWFLDGQTAAAMSGVEDMQAMSIGLGADAAVAALHVGEVDRALRGLAEALAGLRGLDAGSSLRAAYCHRVIRHTVLWARSQIEGRDTKIDGEPIAMLPGTCSNPDPPAAVRDLPLGPIDLAWYMLAEAEIASGVDIGVLSSLRDRLARGPIPVLELGVRNRLLRQDISTLDARGFAKHLQGFIEGMAFFRSMGNALSATWNVLDPPRGEIPPIGRGSEVDSWAEPVAVDAILAFCASAALAAKPEFIEALEQELVSRFGRDYLGRSVFEHWRGDEHALAELDRMVADLIAALRGGGHMEPRALWGTGLRLFEKAGHSPFKAELIIHIAAWLRAEFRRIVAEESFRLSRPTQAIPLIEAALRRQDDDERFVASLLLDASDAVGANLGTVYRNHLKVVASGGLPAGTPSPPGECVADGEDRSTS